MFVCLFVCLLDGVPVHGRHDRGGAANDLRKGGEEQIQDKTRAIAIESSKAQKTLIKLGDKTQQNKQQQKRNGQHNIKIT